MAGTVKLNSDKLSQLSAQATAIEQECLTHYKYLDKVRQELDWNVRQKIQIDATLDGICRRMTAQQQKIAAIASAANLAASGADTTNTSLKNQIINILLKITSIFPAGMFGGVLANVLGSYVGDILFSMFGITPPHFTSVEELQNWLKGLQGTQQNAGTNQGQQQTTPTPAPTPSAQPTQPEQEMLPKTLKQYSDNGSAYRGYDYSAYGVVKGFDSQFCYNQNNYSRFVQNGKNVGCTATAEAIAVSAFTGQAFTPDQAGWGKSGATWSHCTKTPLLAKNTYSAEQGYAAIYNKVKEGSPVIIRMKDSGGGGHSVTAVGIRPNCASGNPAASDILVVDPGDGKVKTLAQIYNGSKKMSMDTSWSLLLPKA